MFFAVVEYDFLLGLPDPGLRWILPAIYVVLFLLGVWWARHLRSARPEVYEMIGRGANAATGQSVLDMADEMGRGGGPVSPVAHRLRPWLIARRCGRRWSSSSGRRRRPRRRRLVERPEPVADERALHVRWLGKPALLAGDVKWDSAWPTASSPPLATGTAR